jgi:tetratricopeptide (TPR) repeat protein
MRTFRDSEFVRSICAIALGIALLGTAAVSTRAEEKDGSSKSGKVSVLELVEECDVLAAHPADPNRMADGVADDKIVPRLAILACEDAIKREAGEARFVFQLGRALLAAGQKKQAFKRFNDAAASSYGAAWAYLGDAYQFGLGTEVNGKKAFEAYKKAYAAGFEEAKSQIEGLQFDASMYSNKIPAYFFEGKYDEILRLSNDTKLQWVTRNYTFTYIQALLKECKPFLKPKNVPALYAYRYPKHWKSGSNEEVVVAIQTSVAEHDASAFVARHGCDGLIANHVKTSINLFLARSS